MSISSVVVTELEFRKAEAVFTAAPGVRCLPAPADEDGLTAAILESGARHAIVGTTPYREGLYSALSRGAVLARFGVGHDGIDKAKATAAGLLCTNTPGVLDQSVAEHTMLLMAAAARHLLAISGPMQNGSWAPRGGTELCGKTLAVIGCGPIGCAVARLAYHGFRMRVVGCRRSPIPAEHLHAENGFEKVVNDFEAAVRDADYVSLHIPATPENRNFINRERLELLGPATWLINTARGAVLDETALYRILAERRIGGAALDVFEREPYEPAEPAFDLRTLDNTILTPHVGSNTTGANCRMAERALRNIALAETGDFASMNLLNPEVLSSRPAMKVLGT